MDKILTYIVDRQILTQFVTTHTVVLRITVLWYHSKKKINAQVNFSYDCFSLVLRLRFCWLYWDTLCEYEYVIPSKGCFKRL